MGKGHRPQRLAEEIRKVVSQMLTLGKLKDPALQCMIGISGVDVTADGSYATVYVTAMSYSGRTMSDDEKKQILTALEKAKGFMRSEINKAVKVRFVPDLIFKFDNSFEYGAKMDRIIDSLDIPPAPAVETEEDDF